MNLFLSLGVAVRAYRSILPLMLRPTYWLPFLFLAAVQVAALGLLVGFHHPLIAPLGVPLVRLLGGERATHYPVLLLFLPGMYARVVLVLAVVVASLVVAVATLNFARALGFEARRGTGARIQGRMPSLILVSVPPALAIVGLSLLAGLVPPDIFLGNSTVRWGVRGALLVAIILVQSFSSYSTAWVVLQGHSVLAALRDSIRVTARTFMPTLFVVAFPVLALWPLSYWSQRADLFTGKLQPETITTLLGARIVGEFFLGFLIVGAITRLFLWRTEAAR